MTFSLVSDYGAHVEEYRSNWDVFDKTLYTLCDKHTSHADLGATNAKLWLIGRALATGVERHVPKSKGQGSSLDKMAAHLHRNSREADELIQRLRAISEPLDSSKLADIVGLHGKFCKLVSRIARSSLASFASKYLHYHSRVVPIFDKFVFEEARRRHSEDGLITFAKPKGAISGYYYYALCFWQLYSKLRRLTKPVNVRLAEGYIGRLAWLAANGKSPAFNFAG